MRLRLRLLLGILGLALLGVPLFAVDGPLTNALNLRVKTDTNGYLIAAGGTYSGTDGPYTNFGNLRLRTDGNGYLIVAFSGTQVVTTINAPAATALSLGAAGASQWQINITGYLFALTDNTYDIGAAAANRPRDLYVGRSGYFATSVNVGTAPTLFAAAPTIASFAGTSPAATVTAGSTASAFRIGVGGTAPGTTGTINLPTATTGWNCWIVDQTTPLDITRQTSSTTSSVGITSTIAWSANDILVGSCVAF